MMNFFPFIQTPLLHNEGVAINAKLSSQQDSPWGADPAL